MVMSTAMHSDAAKNSWVKLEVSTRAKKEQKQKISSRKQKQKINRNWRLKKFTITVPTIQNKNCTPHIATEIEKFMITLFCFSLPLRVFQSNSMIANLVHKILILWFNIMILTSTTKCYFHRF